MRFYIYYGALLVLTVSSFAYLFIRTKKAKRPLWFFALLILVSNAVWSFPLYYLQRASMEPWGRFFNSVAHATYHSAVLFGLEGNLAEVKTLKDLLLSRGVVTPVAVTVSFFAALYYFLAPLITVSAVVSLLRDYFSFALFWIKRKRRRDIYVFSELNERSITLAQSIIDTAKENKKRKSKTNNKDDNAEDRSKKRIKREKEPRAKPLIVFCDVFSRNTETSFELRDTASRIGAICLKRDIAAIDNKWCKRIGKRKRGKFVKFFLIGENEDENLEQTVELVGTIRAEKKAAKQEEKTSENNNQKEKSEQPAEGSDIPGPEKERESAEQKNKLAESEKKNKKEGSGEKIVKEAPILYLFSKSSASEFSLQNLFGDDKKLNVNVIRVDYKRSMIYNYLYKSGKEIIKLATDDGKKFKVLILGMGEHGFEMVKALLWFCRRTGYSLKINVYDSRDDVESRFYEQCPDINRVNKGDRLIEFKTVDFNSSEFYKYYLIKHPDANFVFISLRDDGNNIALAKKTREFFAKKRIEKNAKAKNEEKADIMDSPIITTVVENSEVKQALKDNGFKIRIIGDFKSVYSTEVIINSDLETIAKEVHSGGKGDSIATYKKQKFYKEYYYRSTLAQVIYHLAWRSALPDDETWNAFQNAAKSVGNESDIRNTKFQNINDLGEIVDLINNRSEKLDKFFSNYKEYYSDNKEKWNVPVNWKNYLDENWKKMAPDVEYVEVCKAMKNLYGLLNSKIKKKNKPCFFSCFTDEKDRWNYYELTEGYKKYTGASSDPDVLSLLKNDLHRHPLIKRFGELSNPDAIMTDELTGKPLLTDRQSEAKYFIEAYRNLIKKAGEIESKAREIEKEKNKKNKNKNKKNKN